MRVSPFGEKSIWLIRSLFSRNTFATRKLRMVLSTSFILSEDKSRHLQSGSALGSLHGGYMTSLTSWSTRCSTWHKITQGTQPLGGNTCAQLGRCWWAWVGSFLLSCACGTALYFNSPKWVSFHLFSSLTKWTRGFVWGHFNTVVLGLKCFACRYSQQTQLSEASAFYFQPWASFVYFLSLCLEWSSL